jgi:hypothetical protein
MHLLHRPARRPIHRFVFALLTGVLLLSPESLRAEHDGTCHPPSGWTGRFGLKTFSLDVDPFPLLRLRANVTRNGTAHVHGTIRTGDDDADGRRLLAARGGGEASCADADGDGRGGLTRLAADFRDGQDREPVHVIVQTLPGQDIDSSGVYSVLLHRGGITTKVVVQVHLRHGGSPRGR